MIVQSPDEFYYIISVFPHNEAYIKDIGQVRLLSVGRYIIQDIDLFINKPIRVLEINKEILHDFMANYIILNGEFFVNSSYWESYYDCRIVPRNALNNTLYDLS
jgi:hypothetical protein